MSNSRPDADELSRARDAAEERDQALLDRLDRLADYAPATDGDPLAGFTPRTLGERHAECLRKIDRGLDRVEELVAEIEGLVESLLPRERGW